MRRGWRLDPWSPGRSSILLRTNSVSRAARGEAACGASCPPPECARDRSGDRRARGRTALQPPPSRAQPATGVDGASPGAARTAKRCAELEVVPARIGQRERSGMTARHQSALDEAHIFLPQAPVRRADPGWRSADADPRIGAPAALAQLEAKRGIGTSNQATRRSAACGETARKSSRSRSRVRGWGR